MHTPADGGFVAARQQIYVYSFRTRGGPFLCVLLLASKSTLLNLLNLNKSILGFTNDISRSTFQPNQIQIQNILPNKKKRRQSRV